MKEGFENVTADLAEHKQAVFEFEQKEKEMTSVIQDLTSIVKEQKAKIAELTKANEEATANLKVLVVSKRFNCIYEFFCNILFVKVSNAIRGTLTHFLLH